VVIIADRIKGITVEIGGDTVGLQKALKEVNTQSRNLTTELKDVQKLLKFDPGNVELIAQKQKLLSDQVETTTKKLNTLREAQKQVQAQFDAGDIGEEQYRAFNRELAATESSLKSTQSAMANMAAEQSKVETSTTQLNNLFKATKTTIDNYSDVLGTKLVNAINNGTATSKQLETAFDLVGKEAIGSEADIDKLRASIERMETGEASIRQVRTEITKLAREAEKAKVDMAALGGNLQSAGQGLATGFGTAAVVIGGAIASSTQKSIEFEAQLSRVGAIAGATTTELDELRASALELGASTSKSATEIALGQEALAALGFTANEIIGAMPGVIAAAEASGSDMAQTAEVMASTLNVFGLSAEHATDVADVLAQTANVSAASLTDMQYALKYAAPPAAALGISFEELSASIGIMTNAGMKGEQAGTTLRGALLGLLDPSVDNAKAMETMGIAVTDAEGNFVGISALIENMSVALADQTDTQKAATIASLVGKEAVSGMLSLMAAGSDEIDKMTESLENSGGASAEAAAKMKDNLAGTLDELSGSFETLQISIGTALTPLFESLAKSLQKVADWFNELSPGTKKFIAIALLIVAAITGIIAVFGIIIAVIGSVISGFTAIAGLGITMAGIMAVLTSPITLVIAAIVALVAIGVLLYKNWDTISAKAIEIWGSIKEWFIQVFESIKSTITDVWDGISTKTTEVWESVKSFMVAIWDGIVAGVTAIITPFVNGITNIFEGMKGGLTKIFNGIKLYFTTIWEIIKTIFLGAILLITDLVTGDFDQLKKDAIAIFDKLKAAFATVWVAIKLIFTGALDAIKGFFKATWENIKTNAETIWTAISTFFTRTIEAIKTTLTNLPGIIAAKFEEFKSTITTKITEAVEKIKTTWAKVKAFFEGIDLKQIGKDIIQGLIDGIGSMFTKLSNKAKELADSVGKSIRGALKIGSPSKLTTELGEFTGEGFVDGLSNSISQIKDMSKQLATAVVPKLTIPKMESPSLAAAGTSSPGKSLTVNITSPKALDVKEASREFNKQLNKMSLMW
jgi:TP901 family phage tail tape measure protein